MLRSLITLIVVCFLKKGVGGKENRMFFWTEVGGGVPVARHAKARSGDPCSRHAKARSGDSCSHLGASGVLLVFSYSDRTSWEELPGLIQRTVMQVKRRWALGSTRVIFNDQDPGVYLP